MHWGQPPSGASSGSSVPHCGHRRVSVISERSRWSEVVYPPFNRSFAEGYRNATRKAEIPSPHRAKLSLQPDLREQLPQLFVDFGFVRHGLGDFGAEPIAAAMAQAVHGDLHRSLGHL